MVAFAPAARSRHNDHDANTNTAGAIRRCAAALNGQDLITLQSAYAINELGAAGFPLVGGTERLPRQTGVIGLDLRDRLTLIDAIVNQGPQCGPSRPVNLVVGRHR